MHQRQVGGHSVRRHRRRSIGLSRTETAYKYTGIAGSKICDTYILQIQKGSSSPCANGQSKQLISLFRKNGRDLP